MHAHMLDTLESIKNQHFSVSVVIYLCISIHQSKFNTFDDFEMLLQS